MSLKYAYLGPAGTFTQAALQKIAASTDELIPYANVTAALNAVRSGECAKALVPIENSVEGVVARTLDELAIGEALVITAETTLPVTFSLMILEGTDVKDIKSIATHPHAESQFRQYLAKTLPKAQVNLTALTAAATKALGPQRPILSRSARLPRAPIPCGTLSNCNLQMPLCKWPRCATPWRPP